MIDITLEHVTKIFISGKESITALDNVSVSIDRGSFTSIIGQSGSGKTTLLNLIAGLDQPSSGEIFFNDKRISEFSEETWNLTRNSYIGFIFQNFMLLPEFTALENIMLPHLIETRNKDESLKKAEELLDLINLSKRAHLYPKQLSGGECQRIAIARAIINHPRLILADEPTGNLDKKNQELVMDLLLTLQHRLNLTVIMVTHNLVLAQQTDRILTLSFGKLLPYA